MKRSSKHSPERSWAELCCLDCSFIQLFWPRVVMRKWFNISAKESDYSADTDDEEEADDADSDTEEFAQSGRKSRFRDEVVEDDAWVDPNDALPRMRRRKSETFRAQYINTKELRVCVGTWNVGGKIPPDDLDIDDWLDINEPADIYVLGLQEIVPLNAGNIFGAEDSRPVSKWESIIREALNRVRPRGFKIKSFSDPPSPSKYRPSHDVPDIEEEMLESDSDVGDELHDIGEEVHPLNDEIDFDESKDRIVACEHGNLITGISNCNECDNTSMPVEQDFQRQFSSPRRLDRLNCMWKREINTEESGAQQTVKLTKMLSGTERIGLSWPEPPLNLLSQHILERPRSFNSIKSFKVSRSFKTNSSFKSTLNNVPSDIALLAEIDLEAIMKRKRRSSFVRIVSKQMVGIFVTIWVRRSLRRHIQNLNVSTVGVGVMGYIGNKGSISVSMSIYQTLFCFICTHLTAGEKHGDELKRNSDVKEILRRTHFHSFSGIGLPKSIHDHERIIWYGDLNYRLNMSYEKTRELISKKEWSKLQEMDQLVRELKKGRAFDGWSEGTLKFPPTYKYELNSDKYYGDDPRTGRRTPAWCDRVLSYGKGMRLLKYRRAELKFSDHRPVTATYMAEVEVFSPRRLQKALTFTDAEIENNEIVTDMTIEVGMNRLLLEQEISDWKR
nr:type IV inositol polyphosphate 5-phosphatase 3-like isoform X1 [Ziziphus jujuba var. spinosa]